VTAVGLRGVQGHLRALDAVSDRVDRQPARRALNVAAAGLGLLAAAPLMLLIGLAVRVSSPGPMLYKQTRVGLDRRWRAVAGGNGRRRQDVGGKPFTIYKFRTMYVSGPDAPQTWAADNDPRITPVGRILRSFRLDELPQLFNVLSGDMNIVGPRPEQPQIFADLKDDLHRYRTRQRVLPGITGLAQVSLPYDKDILDVHKKVRLDLEYIRRRSPGEDLLIMAKTMPVMMLRKGWK